MDTIIYNHLNLPHTITGTGGTINNVYDASGKKWQSTNGGVTTTYFGDIEYERPIPDDRKDDVRQCVKGVNRESGWAGAIKAIYHPDGRILKNGSTYDYQYYVKDHLGNVRIVCNSAGTIQSEQHYYPFGLNQEGNFTSTGTSQKYLYNGKELYARGLGWYDYGARFYDASIGRFTGVDPLAEKYPSISPYAYVANNPINAIDPDGKRIIFINGYKGFGSPKGGESYWGGSNSSFVSRAMKYLNDKDTYFADINHGALSSNSTRISAGRKWAEENLATLTDGLTKELDDIKFVTHSMGAAFSEGVSEYLKEQGWTITNAIHFNAYQADGLNVDGENTTVIDYQLNNDPVKLFGPTSNPGRIKGAKTTVYEKGKSDIEYRHREPIDSGEIWSRLNTLIEDALKRDGNTKINIKN